MPAVPNTTSGSIERASTTGAKNRTRGGAGELEEVQAALDRFAPAGEVLELAYGTGEWTLRLAAMASRVTGIDAAPEMRERGSVKLQAAGHTNVDLLIGDLFAWEPDQVYDAVVFAFWLSHVPLDRADRFWENVHHSLRPGGRFFLADVVRIADRFELPGVVVDGSVVHHSSGALDLAALSTCGGSKTGAATGS